MIIIGAGGHAKVVMDIALSCDVKVKGFLDDNTKQFQNIDYLGTIDCIEDLHEPLVIAIGDNVVRKLISLRAKSLTKALIHPSAIIGSNVLVGNGTVIMPSVSVNASVNIGINVIVNTSASIDHDCILKDYAHISPNATLCGGVQVGEGVHIGAGATVIPGIKIGDWSVIGAGSVVTKDIPANCTAVGHPARVIKHAR